MKGILVKIIAVVILFILMIGFVFFRKDEYKTKPSEGQPAIQQEEVPAEKIIRELTEEDKLKRLAENFVSIYYSYSWGNFSNIESQYSYMSYEMEKKERIKVEQFKKETENQLLTYFGVSSIPQETSIYYIDQSRAEVKIEFEQYEIEGVSIYVDGVLTGVDKLGNASSFYPVYRKIYNKNVLIELLRENDEWKVNKLDNL